MHGPDGRSFAEVASCGEVFDLMVGSANFTRFYPDLCILILARLPDPIIETRK